MLSCILAQWHAQMCATFHPIVYYFSVSAILPCCPADSVVCQQHNSSTGFPTDCLLVDIDSTSWSYALLSASFVILQVARCAGRIVLCTTSGRPLRSGSSTLALVVCVALAPGVYCLP
jgi:hypothetical protein